MIYVLRKIFEKENEKHQKEQKEKIKGIMKKKRQDEKDASNKDDQAGPEGEEDLC